MAATLVTLEEVQARLKLEDEDGSVVEAAMAEAEDRVLQFIERIDSGWTSLTVPASIKGAIIMVTGHLLEHRGDEEMSPDPLTPGARSMLKMWRDPALA